MDFIRPDDHIYPNYYVRLKSSIIFSKLLKANYEEQMVEVINFPIKEQILVEEFTRTFPITEKIFETLKSIKRSQFFWTFTNYINYTVTFKLIMQNNKEHIHINIKKFWDKTVFEEPNNSRTCHS